LVSYDSECKRLCPTGCTSEQDENGYENKREVETEKNRLCNGVVNPLVLLLGLQKIEWPIGFQKEPSLQLQKFPTLSNVQLSSFYPILHVEKIVAKDASHSHKTVNLCGG
jgi:hypothetical protein